jgi:hypothetical protein
MTAHDDVLYSRIKSLRLFAALVCKSQCAKKEWVMSTKFAHSLRKLAVQPHCARGSVCKKFCTLASDFAHQCVRLFAALVCKSQCAKIFCTLGS